MNIWLRDTSLLGARVHFNNGPDEIPEEVIKSCAGIEFWAPSYSKFQDTIFIYVSQLCQKLKEKNFGQEAKWLEENCSGTITLKTSNVNVF